MQIRKTTLSDLDHVMEIYAFARQFMKEHDNPDQWGGTNWPPRALIEQDISNGNSYVCLSNDQDVIGVFYFNYGKCIEPCYEGLKDVAWTGDKVYGVVHRIASDGKHKGVGSFCLNWAFDQCKAKSLRIDTHPNNYVMQNLLAKLGFIRRGIVHVPEDDMPRYAYERTE